MRRLVPFVAVLLTLSLAAPLGADVFWRWRAAARSRRAYTAMGARLAYRAPVEVNGGKGHLSVYHFPRPMPDVADALQRAFGSPLSRQGASMAQGAVTEGGDALQLLLVAMPGGERTVLFEVKQPLDDRRRSARGPPPASTLGPLPLYPGADLSFHARDLRTQTALAMLSARALPADVDAFYRAQLGGAGGWKVQPGPEPQEARAARLRIFARGNELCLLMAAPDERHGSRITLLHKRFGLD
jgi:hypothetical protein